MNVRLKHGLIAGAILFAVNASATELETEEQKLGYIIGMDVGQSLRMQGAEVDLETLFDAIRTMYEGGTPAMTEAEAELVREAYVAERQAEQGAMQAAIAEKNLQEGLAFLAANAGQDGVQVTASGLQYKVLEPGSGASPSATDTVTVHYRGTLLDGTEFDSSYARGEPISFALDRVIPGWTEGVQLMQVGSKYQFWIGPQLGYGEAGGGPIPPNATLVFEVELLGIES
jgi:FKBP-type peptidyl-prolyl cis-trans isomerase FkpA/FKBP-type peptidyl-prolyl cis-trans isomerase FklB